MTQKGVVKCRASNLGDFEYIITVYDKNLEIGMLFTYEVIHY